tara:strand:+ start:243 stop:491 length:249 start_codon:yes stop_codon:yes gene_type:complete
MVRIKLGVDSTDKDTAKAIHESLLPDNVSIPKGLSVKMCLEGSQLLVDVSSKGEWDTLISTIDEIVEHIQLACSVIRLVINL